MRTNDLIWYRNTDKGELRAAQLDRINRQLVYMADRSAHWWWLKERLPLSSWEDFQKLPTMDADDILKFATKLVCISQRQVKRIVSQTTSGTKSIKRIYFTDNDLRRTEDFFFRGMQYMCRKGDRAMILLPGTAPDGVSDLLRRGLERNGTEVLVYGAVTDYEKAAQALRGFRPDCIIAMPMPLRRLALMTPDVRVRTVLLSADHIPRECKRLIAEIWGADVFEHYGMTETGFGLAVECPVHQNLHLRNDDFYVEVLDPLTEQVLPPGQAGVLTVTSLRSEAMPLLRYKTGDMGILTEAPCGCGLNQPAIVKILGRKQDPHAPLTMARLDDILASNKTLLDWNGQLRQNELLLSVIGSENISLSKIEEQIRMQCSQLQVRIFRTDALSADPKRKRGFVRMDNSAV